MKRAIVIGCPGSGKSTFATALAKRVCLPLYHLDRLYWNADRTTVDRATFLARLEAVLAEEKWIIDGHYATTLPRRLAAADTVFLLDYPLSVCLEGVRARVGRPRPDMPWQESEVDPAFLDYVRRFRDEQWPQVEELLAGSADKNWVIFRTREEAAAYLDRIALK